MNTLIIIVCIIGYLIVGFICDCVAHATNAGDMEAVLDFALITLWPFLILAVVIITVAIILFSPLSKLRDKIALKIREVFMKNKTKGERK